MMGIFDKLKGNKIITAEDRKRRSDKKIKTMGIAYLKTLPVMESSDEVSIKSMDEMCRRAIACLLSIQLACDIDAEQDYNESKKMFSGLLKKYGVEDCLLTKEKALFDNKFTQQDAVDVAWTYEAYWSVVWALGLVDDIEAPNSICDCEKAITLVGDCESYDEFKSHCRLRDVEEILDMLDLYYRYHWACVEKTVRPETPIGALNPEVVMERRRGLEWLVSPEDDWNEISLDT